MLNIVGDVLCWCWGWVSGFFRLGEWFLIERGWSPMGWKKGVRRFVGGRLFFRQGIAPPLSTSGSVTCTTCRVRSAGCKGPQWSCIHHQPIKNRGAGRLLTEQTVP